MPIGRKTVSGTFLRSTLPGDKVPVYLVHQPQYYDRPELYRENGHDYKDNCERFVFFCRAVLEAITAARSRHRAGPLPRLDRRPGAGLSEDRAVRRAAVRFASRSLLTIHNIAYQGNFWHWDMELTGIDWKYFNWRQMEFYGNLNFLKTGLAFADALSTVSPRYAQEIQAPPLGCGLEGILQHRRDDLFGIINGVDYASGIRRPIRTWAATTTASRTLPKAKRACKAALQREVGLPQVADQPLVAMIGRLADQKGFDLVAKVIPQWAPTRRRAMGDPGHRRAAVSRAVRRAGASSIRTKWRCGSASPTSWPIASKPAPTSS